MKKFFKYLVNSMKKFLGIIYYNLFKKWSPIIQLIVFLTIVGYPTCFFKKMFNNELESLFSIAWLIFIVSIP